VTGASGIFGHAFCQHLLKNKRLVTGLKYKHPIGILGITEINIDLKKTSKIKETIRAENPDWIVHAAGITSVDDCEKEPELAATLHVAATQALVDAAKNIGAGIVYISTDHLWDGKQKYVKEETPTCPINVYAKTKLEGEKIVLNSTIPTVVIRTNFFGTGRPWHPSFSDWLLHAITNNINLNMFSDVYFSPIALKYLCPIITDIVKKNGRGVYHVAGNERLSKYHFAKLLAQMAGYTGNTLNKTSIIKAGLSAPRPTDMSLNTQKVQEFLGHEMPNIETSLTSLFQKN
jgi:dTDP-4-dehydrorhamnose reductase